MDAKFDAKQFMIDNAAADLKPFIGKSQLAVMVQSCKGEEGDWFITRMVELAAEILAMPKTYEQDGKGDAACAYLHYFKGSADWYITERDMEPKQHQAFGLANLGHGDELGYISITELCAAGVELDLHFTPNSIGNIRQRKAA